MHSPLFVPRRTLGGTLALAAFACLPAGVARAQAAADAPAPAAETRGTESVEIEPYEGPPVFLPQGPAPPPPTETQATVVTEKFPDGETPRFERRVVRLSDNTLINDGPHKEYFSNGQLYVSGAYRLGKPVGHWTYHHDNGALAKEIDFIDGKPEGEVRITSPEGRLLAVRNYKGGARDGEWLLYNPTGDSEEPIAVQNFKLGKPDGEWRTYFSDGQIRQQGYFKEGLRDGLTTEWSRTGEKRAEANFRAGKRHGAVTVWQRGGRVIKQTYEEGQLVDQSSSGPEG